MIATKRHAPAGGASAAAPVGFHAHPDHYRHWQLVLDGDIARLLMAVDESAPLRPGYALKLNSYDFSVDIELADAVMRLRFEHPEVTVVVVTSAQAGCFCAARGIKGKAIEFAYVKRNA